MSKFEQTGIEGLVAFTSARHGDARGYFVESYKKSLWQQHAGLMAEFIQINRSKNTEAGVLRGLHFQTGDTAQTKLVEVLAGKAQVAVADLRRKSDTFGKAFTMILTEESGEQLWVPKGFAHGYLALEPNTKYSYMVDAPYSQSTEAGLDAFDPDLDILWELPLDQIKRKDADTQWPTLSQLVDSNY